MSTATTVPLTITPEAAEHIARLGMQAEFEQMLDYIRRNTAGLRHIQVTLAPPYDTGDEDSVLIEGLRDPAAFALEDVTWDAWSDWVIATFSPDVHRHFTLLFIEGDSYVG